LAQKTRPTPPLQWHFREIVLPARPLHRLFREKVLPARVKTPNLGQFERAGRIFSRFHDLPATQGELFRACRRRPSSALPISDPSPTGMEGARGAGGHGRIRGDAQSRTSATRPNWYGGRRRARRARPRRQWITGPGRGIHKRQQHPAQANFACNSPRHGSTHAQKPQNINDQTSIVEILLGELHAKLPRSSQDSVPCRDQAPLLWRASEGLEGLAAVPVGGGGAWPDNESTRRVKLAARTTRGRAAAHGHTKQPGPPSSPAHQAARPHTPTGGAQCES